MDHELPPGHVYRYSASPEIDLEGRPTGYVAWVKRPERIGTWKHRALALEKAREKAKLRGEIYAPIKLRSSYVRQDMSPHKVSSWQDLPAQAG
jgi:hypothetical protein